MSDYSSMVPATLKPIDILGMKRISEYGISNDASFESICSGFVQIQGCAQSSYIARFTKGYEASTIPYLGCCRGRAFKIDGAYSGKL